jgi:RHS repeat-associated protein
MKKFILSAFYALLFANCLYAAYDVANPDGKGGATYFDDAFILENRRSEFWVGEEISIPLGLDCCDCFSSSSSSVDPESYRIDFDEGVTPINLTLKRKERLTKDEIKLYYAENEAYLADNHWRNKQGCWYEFVGTATEPGTYSGNVKIDIVKQLLYQYKMGEHTYYQYYYDPSYGENTLHFSFDVKPLDYSKDGSSKPISKATIVSRDAAASYSDQAEIYSYLKNNTESQQTLDNPFMDYYMTLPDNQQIGVFSIWKLPENSCIQILECGNNNYVFRHKYSGIQTLNAGASLGEFQLGLYETPNTRGDLNWFAPMSEKLSVFDANEDFSYLYPAENNAHAAARNEHYNYKMASFEKNGTLLYGSYPSWLNSSCRVIQPKERVQGETSRIQYRTTSKENLVFCGDEVVNPSSPITIEFDKEDDFIYEGEDYFALPTVTSTEGEIESLEITYQDQFDWLETGTPNDYWANNYGNSGHSTTTSAHTKTFYVRSINHAVRQNHNLPVGTYTYTLKAKDTKNNEAVVTRTVRIVDGSEFQPNSNNGSGLAVLTGDETWFTTNQLDIASGIERYADADMYYLKKGYHYDYFGHVEGLVQNFKSVFNNWYSDDGISQTLYDCGEGRYKIKYEVTCDSRWSVNFNQSILDVKTGIVYGSLMDMHKEKDYSMAPFVENNKLKLYARKYNPNVPLYDEKGNLLWGNPPEWANQCTDFVKVLPYKTNEPRCDDGSSSGGDVVVIPEKKLTVQFYDVIPDNSKQGNFNFKISNEGSRDVSLDGYEIRFYYGGEGVTNVSDITFNAHDREFDYVTISEERCTDNQYVLKMRIKNGSVALAGNTFPQYEGNNIMLFPQTRTWSDFNKTAMYSYETFDKLTNNPKIALFDSYGNQVYGYPPPMECNILNNNDYVYKFRSLTTQFQDVDANVSTKKADFKFQVANSGFYTAPLGNYEMRFYFQSKGAFDASAVNFENQYVGSADVSKKWCGAGQYYLSMKLGENAVIAANGVYPSQQPIHVSAKMGNSNDDFSKKDFDSWLEDALQMKDNSRMALYDAYGSLVYGEPPFACANPIVVGPNSTIDKPRFQIDVKENIRNFEYNENGKVTISNGVNDVSLRIENKSDIDETGPVYIDYYITHPDGQNPLFCYSVNEPCFPNLSSSSSGFSSSSFSSSSNGNIEFSLREVEVNLTEDMSVIRYTVGNKHVYRFTLKNGLASKKSKEIEFALRDNCIECVYKNEALTFFTWNLNDDWSAKDWIAAGGPSDFVKTERVVILSKEGTVLYGWGDDGMPSFKVLKGEGDGPEVEIPGIVVQEQSPNRTDAISYFGGQLLLNGDFEDPSLLGWDLDEGEAKSIRGATIQGSRFLKLNGTVIQKLPSSTMSLLLDSGAVLSFWHRSESCKENESNNKITVSTPYSHGSMGPRPNTYSFACSKKWKKETVLLSKGSIMTDDDDVFSITFKTWLEVDLDDITLIPGRSAQPSTYAVRLTTTQHEELETRAYDNERDSVIVTSSKRDAMGRTWYKYLPYKSKCTDAENCNADAKTLKYVDKATLYYDVHPDYAAAQGVPYAETQWKPDPAATKDVEGAPGKAFSLDKESTIHHVSRAYSSGVNLSNIDKMDFYALASAINAVRNCRVFADGKCNDDGSSDDGVYNFHAAKDTDPTHMWELNIDPNGNAAFTVKDGEGHVVISGAMKKPDPSENSQYAYKLVNRSVNILDARGNVIKAHSPLSCDYKPTPANCVLPSEYEYDSQSRVIRSKEPDAGTTLTYYDLAGRVRATQTQNQINRKIASVSVYDHLDRVVATGEWAHGYDESNLNALREKLLLDENGNNGNFKFPTEKDLTPGTITRTFYDEAPLGSDYGVQLYPDNTTLDYTRGRVAAVISDVPVGKNDDGTDKIIRVSTANSYDKYGRVVKTYTYDPTISAEADSLNMLAVETEYDLGGKILSTTKYPYGLTLNGRNRGVTETYVYDRLGRIERIMTKNGGASPSELARYYYFPTGAVRGIVLGNSISMFYLYHISGAVKRVEIKDAKNQDLYSETLDYEDCGVSGCSPQSQYNGNISRMVHEMAVDGGKSRNAQYVYDELNRLTKVKDSKQPEFDEIFEYDDQGRITAQHRAEETNGQYALNEHPTGGEYSYYPNTNRLKSVSDNMGGKSTAKRKMSYPENFVYDSEGNLTFDKSKELEISYDWRGMPIEFKQLQQPAGSSDKNLFKLTMSYDGSGRRISKTRWVKNAGSQDWEKELVTHYTGIGTEIREDFTKNQTKVVVNMPEGFGRYGVEDASGPDKGFGAGYIPNTKFEWYLKNHLGSTMLVYGTQANAAGGVLENKLEPLAAYDYRAFGEQVNLVSSNNGVDKVTENFTGKELDDEIALNYFGARYLDPMLALWISVDPKRQYQNPYLYASNNPVLRIDPDGNQDDIAAMIRGQFFREQQINTVAAVKQLPGAFKQGVIDASHYVSFAQVAIPVTCALVGVSMPVGLTVAFIAYNAVSSGLQYGSTGASASLAVDAASLLVGIAIDSRFPSLTPGGRAVNSVLGNRMKQAASVGAQNAANNFSHDLVDLFLSPTNFQEDYIPSASSVATSASSVAPKEDD